MSIFKKIGKTAVAIVTAPAKVVGAIVLLSKFKDK
jgi:hypothetical protein